MSDAALHPEPPAIDAATLPALFVLGVVLFAILVSAGVTLALVVTLPAV